MIGGQFIGGLFADTLGWRWAFATLAASYLLIGTRVWRESRANPHPHHAHNPSSAGTGLLQQARTVWAKPWARMILTVVFLEGTLIFGGLAFVPTDLHQRIHISLTLAGALMSAFGLGGLSYIVMGRHLLRHLGEFGLATVGGMLLLGAWLTLAFLPDWGWALLATYLANQRHADGSGRAGHGGVTVCFQLLPRPIGGCGGRSTGARPLGQSDIVPDDCPADPHAGHAVRLATETPAPPLNPGNDGAASRPPGGQPPPRSRIGPGAGERFVPHQIDVDPKPGQPFGYHLL